MPTSTRPTSTASATSARTVAPLWVSRGVEQAVLGVSSLLLGVRLGVTDFAPFAALFILATLSTQIGDGGLAFSLLRTPRDRFLARSSLWRVRAVNLALAAIVAGGALLADGSARTVVLGAALLWSIGGETNLRRAATQRSGETARLAVVEAGGALLFLAIALSAIHEPDDLPVLVLAFGARGTVDLVGNVRLRSAFSSAGAPARSTAEWGGQVVTYAIANLDYLVIQLLLGPASLSLYVIAFRLASAFSSIVSNPITRGATIGFTPVASRQERHDQLLRQIGVLGTIGLTGTLVAGPLIAQIMGGDWLDARSLIVVLSIALPFRIGLGSAIALGIASGNAHRVIGWELRRLLLTAALLVPAASVDVELAAGAISAATVVGVVSSYRSATREAGVQRSAAVSLLAAVSVSVIAAATVL